MSIRKTDETKRSQCNYSKTTKRERMSQDRKSVCKGGEGSCKVKPDFAPKTTRRVVKAKLIFASNQLVNKT